MRFAIEIAYRELKQRFGWGHYQVRSREAIERHVALSPHFTYRFRRN